MSTILVAALAAGCTGGEGRDAADGEGTGAFVGEEAPSEDVAAPVAVDLPSTAVATELRWLLAAINAGDVTVDDLEERIHPSLLAEVPAPMLRDVVVQLGTGRPVTVTKYEGDALRATAVLTAATVDEQMRIDLTVRSEPPHLIAGMFLSPIAPEGSTPFVARDVADVEALLTELAPDAAFLLADGSCAPVRAVRADQVRAIASVTKLYVAVAVLEAVVSGELRLTATVPIRSELTSVPPGPTRYQAPGEEVTIETLLTRTMSSSDNTAADHLIDLVGRDAVEAAMTVAGHHDPSLNRPFLTTREMALLKVTGDHERAAAYLAADESDRRTMLERIADVPIGDLTELSIERAPSMIEDLGWFATAEDVCRAWITVRSLMTQVPAADQALGTHAAPGNASYLAFKDGYEPGVSALSWLIEFPDDERTVAVALLDDKSAALPSDTSRRVIGALVPILTEAPVDAPG